MSKKEKLEEYRKKLNWYVFEATDEEYDEEEVIALINKIRILDPIEIGEDYFTPDKSLKRFWKYLEQRENKEIR